VLEARCLGDATFEGNFDMAWVRRGLFMTASDMARGMDMIPGWGWDGLAAKEYKVFSFTHIASPHFQSSQL